MKTCRSGNNYPSQCKDHRRSRTDLHWRRKYHWRAMCYRESVMISMSTARILLVWLSILTRQISSECWQGSNESSGHDDWQSEHLRSWFMYVRHWFACLVQKGAVRLDCEALKIGDNNILEPKGKESLIQRAEGIRCLARVGRGVALTNGCIIGAKCSLTTNEIVPENTWIFGASVQRMIMPDQPKVDTYLFYSQRATIMTTSTPFSFPPRKGIFSERCCPPSTTWRNEMTFEPFPTSCVYFEYSLPDGCWHWSVMLFYSPLRINHVLLWGERFLFPLHYPLVWHLRVPRYRRLMPSCAQYLLHTSSNSCDLSWTRQRERRMRNWRKASFICLPLSLSYFLCSCTAPNGLSSVRMSKYYRDVNKW